MNNDDTERAKKPFSISYTLNNTMELTADGKINEAVLADTVRTALNLHLGTFTMRVGNRAYEVELAQVEHVMVRRKGKVVSKCP